MKDYRKGGKKTSQTLSTKEFVRRFALHILPKGFTRIQHYGILSSTWKKEKLPALQGKLRDKNSVKNTGDSKEMITAETMLHRCPSCKVGTLKTVLVFDKRGPPENYKEIILNLS